MGNQDEHDWNGAMMDRVQRGEVIDRSRWSSFPQLPFCSAATASLLDDIKAVPQDLIYLLYPLRRLLQTLGISVDHLVGGLRKCVNEVGPEASEAVKKLLVTTACGVVCHRQGSATLNAYTAPTSPSSHLWMCISPLLMAHIKFACSVILRKVQYLHFQ